MTQEKSLREKYLENEIFKIGDIVEDVTTGERMQILDRGSNYLTVAISDSITKKWLSEVKEEVITEATVADANFEILESGQIKLFGHETKNFDRDLSELLIEQFTEFDDLYSKHQIIKCLDYALQEDDIDRAYNLLNKVDEFYKKYKIDAPFIVESMKTDIERKRIVEILAKIAGVQATNSNYNTVITSMKALKSKYQTRKQWEVLYPFIQLAQDSGIVGITQNMPFQFGAGKQLTEEELVDEITYSAIEENIDEMSDTLDLDDLTESFSDDEFSDELLMEVLSIQSRTAMSHQMSRHETTLTARKDRALNRAASSSVLLQRARKLAETMLKRKMFHKAPADMSRQDKERFESGAVKRRALVAKLAQKLIPKVRALQSARLHHTNTPASHTSDIATAKIAKSANGAS